MKYVFGVEPLQQYMVEFDRDDSHAKHEISRLQVLRLSWDTEKREWFYLDAPDVDEKLEPGDELHWDRNNAAVEHQLRRVPQHESSKEF